MVLAASIVGSGELIATTTLGAQVGFAALWIILVSCAIKPVVQGELGRYTVATGHTGLEGFNRIPGPRLGVSWLVWGWALTVTLTLLQVGGMYGGVAQVLHLLVPAISIKAWVVVCLAVTIAVLLGGGYNRIDLCGGCSHAPSWRGRRERPCPGAQLRVASCGAGDGHRGVWNHGRRRDRTRDVSVLVHRKRLRALCRPA